MTDSELRIRIEAELAKLADTDKQFKHLQTTVKDLDYQFRKNTLSSKELDASLKIVDDQAKKLNLTYKQTVDIGASVYQVQQRAEVGFKSLGKSLDTINNSVVKINPAMISLSQGIQDAGMFSMGANVGIRSITNNVQMLGQQLLYLKSSGMSVGVILRGMIGSLAGPMGLLVAFSAVTAAIQFFAETLKDTGKEQEASEKVIQEQTKALNEQRNEVDELVKSWEAWQNKLKGTPAENAAISKEAAGIIKARLDAIRGVMGTEAGGTYIIDPTRSKAEQLAMEDEANKAVGRTVVQNKIIAKELQTAYEAFLAATRTASVTGEYLDPKKAAELEAKRYLKDFGRTGTLQADISRLAPIGRPSFGNISEPLKLETIEYSNLTVAMNQFKSELDDSSITVDDFKSAMWRATDSLANAFMGLVTGTGNLSNVFLSFGESILQMIVQQGAKSVMGGFLGLLGIPGMAAGGPVRPNRSYLVGENGPEMLHLATSGGYITPNHRMGDKYNQLGSLSRFGGQQFHVSVHPIIDNQGLAAQVIIGNNQRNKRIMRAK